MSPGLVLILFIIALIAVPVVVGGLVDAVIDTGARQIEKGLVNRRRSHVWFRTSLDPQSVLSAVRRLSDTLPDVTVAVDGTTAVASMRGVPVSEIRTEPQIDGSTRVSIARAGHGGDSERVKISAAVLSALRTNDPNTRRG